MRQYQAIANQITLNQRILKKEARAGDKAAPANN